MISFFSPYLIHLVEFIVHVISLLCIHSYLNWSIGKRQIDHKISPEDSPKAFTSVSMNEKGYPVMKKLILENFEIIETL